MCILQWTLLSVAAITLLSLTLSSSNSSRKDKIVHNVWEYVLLDKTTLIPFIYLWWEWDSNSQLHTCKDSALPFELHLQSLISFLIALFTVYIILVKLLHFSMPQLLQKKIILVVNTYLTQGQQHNLQSLKIYSFLLKTGNKCYWRH